jgi:hypothetical protein
VKRGEVYEYTIGSQRTIVSMNARPRTRPWFRAANASAPRALIHDDLELRPFLV